MIGAIAVAGALCVAVPAFAGNVLTPETGVGAKFGAHDPYTCSAKTAPKNGPITADMAAQYFTCQFDQVNAFGSLFLAENVHVQIGKSLGIARSVMLFPKDADPDSPVYPIRGSFDKYLCAVVDNSYPPDASGHNCTVWHIRNATGQCYKTGFGDWSCYMDGDSQSVAGQPPPGFTGSAAASKPPAAPQTQAAASPAPAATPTPPAAWSKATSGLPPVNQAAPAQPAAPAKPTGTAAEIQTGMQMFLGGNYHAAYAKFHAAWQSNMNDPLPILWEGVTLEALGKASGFDFLNGTYDASLGIPSRELLALVDWRHGELQDAKTVLDICIKTYPANTSCADMKQGVESGASPPAVKDWPAIVGLTKITKAKAVVWRPKQQ